MCMVDVFGVSVFVVIFLKRKYCSLAPLSSEYPEALRYRRKDHLHILHITNMITFLICEVKIYL